MTTTWAAPNVELIQGPFEDTTTLAEPVALAHLDGDLVRVDDDLPQTDRTTAVGRRSPLDRRL